MDFYLDYLSANNAGLFLPTSIKSYLDGQLDQLEGRMSSLLYKQAVEQDLVAGILADAYQFSGEELKDAVRERPKCAEDQWLHLAGAAGAGDLGGWG